MFWARAQRVRPGIRHDGVMFRPSTTRGLATWLLGIVMTSFYLILYLFPDGGQHPLEGGIRLVDPLSWGIRNEAADKWFLYGTMYTVLVTTMGARMVVKYRHDRYHLARTASVVFRLGFAWLLPGLFRAGTPSSTQPTSGR